MTASNRTRLLTIGITAAALIIAVVMVMLRPHPPVRELPKFGTVGVGRTCHVDPGRDSRPRFRDRSTSRAEAIIEGAKGRFRPIMLTSLTTFMGVAPLVFERSIQAQFLVPMAVSLGFGIIFATAILMMVVPSLTMLQFRGQRRRAEARARRGMPGGEGEAAVVPAP